MPRVPFKCASCSGLRDLRLHLHELSKYCDLLANVRQAGPRSATLVGTDSIAKWLLLASQIDEVLMDTSRFEIAQNYCAPVLDWQESEADHRGSWATRLTRFVFFCNALEETYRFCEPTYERLYRDKTSTLSKGAKMKRPSMKAAFVLREYANKICLPPDFAHLTENFFLLTQVYERELSIPLALSVESPADIAYGLDAVRCLRNHVAHGIFPILENPEYSMAISPSLYHAILNLVNQAVRVGALNIQLLLAIDNDGFQAPLYDQLCDDPDTGDYFSECCDTDYLVNLHRAQTFGLNEVSYYGWSDESTTWRHNHRG